MDCESMMVVKRSVLRIAQIFLVTWRDSGAVILVSKAYTAEI